MIYTSLTVDIAPTVLDELLLGKRLAWASVAAAFRIWRITRQQSVLCMILRNLVSGGERTDVWFCKSNTGRTWVTSGYSISTSLLEAKIICSRSCGTHRTKDRGKDRPNREYWQSNAPINNLFPCDEITTNLQVKQTKNMTPNTGKTISSQRIKSDWDT